VTLTRGFFIGKYEVTQQQYFDVMRSTPSFFTTGPVHGDPGNRVTNGFNHPVENVSWIDATNYCWQSTERGRLAGLLHDKWEDRLATEAEWEYACRAGTTSAFHYGGTLRSGMENFHGDGEYDSSLGAIDNPAGIFLGKTTEVGSYQPNAWGLYDMHGNIREFC